MKVKYIHAHFLISIGDYSNERIGFTVELDEGETAENAVLELRNKAIETIGFTAKKLYQDKWTAQKQLNELTKKLEDARFQWNQTAEFLRQQGIKPDASPMPHFTCLLGGKVEEESTVEAELVDVDDPLF